MTHLFFLDPNPTGTPGVLFLHGLGADGSSWSPQLAPLMDAGFRPLAPDMPGNGESRYDGSGWSFKRVAADLADLLRELDTGPVAVVGLSMGGLVAQQFVLDHPGLVRKLALVSTVAAQSLLIRFLIISFMGLPFQPNYAAQRTFPKPEQESMRQTFLKQAVRTDPRAYRAAILNLGMFNAMNRLREIRVPTLVMTGDQDNLSEPARQKILARHIPGAKQVIFSDTGHAINVEKPDEFNRALLEFLAE